MSRNDLPRIHPREARCRDAELELDGFVLDLVKKHALTEGEALRVVAASAHRWVASVAKYMIREERHGDPEKPGGLT